MRSRIIVDAGHCRLLPLTGKISTDEANDSGFLSTQKVYIMVSYTYRSNKMTSSSLIGALYVAPAGMSVICLHMVIVLKDSWRLEADLHVHRHWHECGI